MGLGSSSLMLRDMITVDLMHGSGNGLIDIWGRDCHLLIFLLYWLMYKGVITLVDV